MWNIPDWHPTSIVLEYGRTLLKPHSELIMLHNPNNWHWVNKDASSWTKQYLEDNMKGIKAEESGVTAQLDKLISMDGDVDVNQRKGKVITIFDVKLVIEYSGMLESYLKFWKMLTVQAKPRMMRMLAAQ